MRDDRKFLFAVILTLALCAAAVWQSHRQEAITFTGGEKVDLPRIERLMEQGLLSDHPADYSAPLRAK